MVCKRRGSGAGYFKQLFSDLSLVCYDPKTYLSQNLGILQTFVYYIITGILHLNFNSPKIVTALSKALYKAQKFGAQ